MRKLRVNIFDDDLMNLKMLKAFMSQRDYEIQTFDRPVICPIYSAKSETCNSLKPCADIILTDYQMPDITGIEMLIYQAQRGCKVDVRNKIVMSADLDNKGRKMLKELGCLFFSKPFQLKELLACLDECEKRIDLSKPLGIIRKENRCFGNIDIIYTYGTGENVFKATVINYSNNGLCLRVDTPPAERQNIVIETKLPIACRNASVLWVKKLALGSYMAGCSCN